MLQGSLTHSLLFIIMAFSAEVFPAADGDDVENDELVDDADGSNEKN